MFRYVALVWNLSSEQQSRTVESLGARLRTRQWSQAFAGAGLRVFCTETSATLRALLLPNDAGVVLGTLLERNRDIYDDSAARRALLTPAGCQAILASRGQWLIDNCWGNYVALMRDVAGGVVRVLKDPTGTLPCFTTRSAGVTVVFAHIGDCVELELGRFSIDREYLRARVLGFNDLQRHALENTRQVRRGECVEIDPAAEPVVRSGHFCWNPLAFVREPQAIEDAERASAAVRATVRSCTQSLSASHASLLHRLSGGLDSSIIAGCLGRLSAAPRIACYTYFNPQGRSDERPWARLAAKHAGLEHLERPIAPAQISLADLVRPRPAIEPLSLLGYLIRSTVEERISAERSATAVFTGDGGDSGFCSDSLGYAVTDYLRRHGMRLTALQLASEVALRTERSTWTVLLDSTRRWLRGARMSEQLPVLLMGSKLASAEVRNGCTIPEDYPHPWFSHVGHVPWDVIRRLGILVTTPEFYNVTDATRAAPEILSPLYAQPAVELFLRIPIHVHAAGGHDRGLARRAFEREVPAPILRRQWKDRAPGFHSEVLVRNRNFVRELFLDGVLVKERLLDRIAVERALAPGPAKTEVLPVEIYRHLDVEIWARYWTS